MMETQSSRDGFFPSNLRFNPNGHQTVTQQAAYYFDRQDLPDYDSPIYSKMYSQQQQSKVYREQK